MHHTKGHFTRAVMEGVAYSLRDSMEEIYKNDVMMNQFRIIGGGAKGKLWKQIVADVLNEPMVCTANNDSSLGSAMLAGVACGMFADYGESVEKCVKVVGVTEPVREHVAVYKEGFEIYRKIQKALAPIYHAVI